MSFLAKLLASAPPDAAVEIAPGHVAAAALGSRGRDRVVQACAIERLPPGTVVPSVASVNIAGWVIAVCIKSNSARFKAALSSPLTNK